MTAANIVTILISNCLVRMWKFAEPYIPLKSHISTCNQQIMTILTDYFNIYELSLPQNLGAGQRVHHVEVLHLKNKNLERYNKVVHF